MKQLSQSEKHTFFVLCLWLCLLMAGDVVIHLLFSLVSLSSPPLLAFFSGFIYLLSGAILGWWSSKIVHHRALISYLFIGALVTLSLSLFVLGIIFLVIGLKQIQFLL